MGTAAARRGRYKAKAKSPLASWLPSTDAGPQGKWAGPPPSWAPEHEHGRVAEPGSQDRQRGKDGGRKRLNRSLEPRPGQGKRQGQGPPAPTHPHLPLV